MGLLQKAATFTALKTSGTLLSVGEVKKILLEQTHKDITGLSEKEKFTVCGISDVYTTSVEQAESILAFGIRHDKKSISAPLFKKRYKEEMQKLRKDRKGTKQKITKEDRLLIKDNINGELYSAAQPVEKLIEVLWDVKDQTIYVGVSSPKVLDSIIHLLLQAFDELNLAPWNPLDVKTKHDPQAKSSRDNFWNAFFTWLFYETRKKDKDKPIWVPGNITFSKNDTSVTIKGDTDISMEVWTSVLASKLVDKLDLGYEVDKQHQFQCTLSKGSWALKQLKVLPEIKHENMESSIFERSQSYKQFIEKFTQLIKQYESIRNDEKKDQGFWESLTTLTSSKIKNEIGGML